MGRSNKGKINPHEAEAELALIETKRGVSRLSRAEETRYRKLQRVVSEFKATQTKREAYKPKDGVYRLGDFQPKGSQIDIVNIIDSVGRVIIQGATGTGKTSTSVWKALNLLHGSRYKRIVFVKNPTEVGDDQIGFLKGSDQDKLVAHFEAMRGIFLDFMSPEKLAADEAKGIIKFSIPNFELGKTYEEDTIVILDETQTWSPPTMKLIIERVKDDCKLIILGDKAQTYSIKKRVDGLSDLVSKVTKIVTHDGVEKRVSRSKYIGFVEMKSDENRRGDWSRYVTDLYAGEVEPVVKVNSGGSVNAA